MKLFSKLLLVVDDAIDTTLLARAFELAREHQAELTILDVIPEPAVSAVAAAEFGGKSALLERIVDGRRERLAEAVEGVAGGAGARVHVIVGRRYLEAIHAVLEHGYDLVLKRAEAPTWLHRFFTSDDLHLLRKCPCPVWLLQPGASPAEKRVLAAIDVDPDAGSPADDPLNRRILRFAAAVAAFEGAEMHVVHAWESPVAGFAALWSDVPEDAERHFRDGEYAARRDVMGAIDARLRADLGEATYRFLEPTWQRLHGRPELRIPEYAAQIRASVVVMGTVARTGIPGLIIGNTAEDILQQLRCGVLAIKPEDFVSPVQAAAR